MKETYYSLDFVSNISHLCMEEIRNRGLRERKIFRKTIPNNNLLIKVFSKQTCTREDLSCIDIHSVATLMQDVLWSSRERIMSKKTWRTINYETCTLSKLLPFISNKAGQFLFSLLDFLVEVMQHKAHNLMDAYTLGDALGKVTLGPSDCSPILSEKAGHLLSRMMIEHAKQQHPTGKKKAMRRIDSGIGYVPTYSERDPWTKNDGTRARARYYDRLIRKIQHTHHDWYDNVIGLQSMLDHDYRTPPEPHYLSIFSPTTHILSLAQDELIHRILQASVRPIPETPSDPFLSCYLFDPAKAYQTEDAIHQAFDVFYRDLQKVMPVESNDRSGRLRKLNHSLSNLKLNIKKYRSRHDLANESGLSEDLTVVDPESAQLEFFNQNKLSHLEDQAAQKPITMKNVMRKLLK